MQYKPGSLGSKRIEARECLGCCFLCWLTPDVGRCRRCSKKKLAAISTRTRPTRFKPGALYQAAGKSSSSAPPPRPWPMCPTQSVERYHDYLIATTTTHSEYLYPTEYNPTSPKILVGFGPEGQVSTQPTLEPQYDASSNQLGMLFTIRTPPRIRRSLDRC